jgi:putative glutamine amidotransferase
MNMPSIYNDRPIIGITCWRQHLTKVLEGRTETNLYTLAEEYVACVRKAGGLPVLLPHGRPGDAARYLSIMDGLLLSGGGDIDPISYGEVNEGLSYDTNMAADQFEMALIHEAKKLNIPTLGICRGVQILTVAFGGKMHQELHHIYPRHPKVKGKEREEILALRHGLRLKPGSQLAQVYGCTEMEVNSIHHQCIRSMGQGFDAVGWSEDGIIEAIESTGSWLCWGVQWHPEKMEGQQVIFDAFIQKVKESMKVKRP